ncbi:Multi antimicrobial extrusion protein, partial [Trema orientale]
TKASNELGAGNPKAARLVACAIMFLAVSHAIFVTSILFVGRSAFGYIFGGEKEVVDYVTSMTPLVCFSLAFDRLHATPSGFFFILCVNF